MKKLVIFDLNKTLIAENSWLNLNLAMGVTKEEDDMLMKWGEARIISDAEGQKILCGIYQKRGDVSRQNIEQILSDFTYLPGAQETVRSLSEMGYAIALISGSMDILVQKVASELGIEYWDCNNRFIFDENDQLSAIETVANDTNYKAQQARKLSSGLQISLADTICVGDGANDEVLFKICGSSITFTDSPIVANASHTISNLTEIPAIVR